ncbi:biotin--[acetyl-CoA-carboxylase] ligase [Rubritalea marina]|uniref:biotin--[acetyl-CoA-carboxylase] ligase n=1 Tax=Rubritalea marina TaxID=361055 RepID=UPI000365FB43|nr:biotin--[acetyl-CoA-carboxylase] ligase [Rubritalea marina]
MKFNSAKFLELMPQLRGLFHYAQELESSNDTASELIEHGSGSGTLVLAEYQTAGRGRGGNAWLCPSQQGLLFSLVLEPTIDRALWSRFSIVAALAVVRAMRRYGISAELKWPNDIWVGGRKLSGILVEGCGEFVIIGIGVNVSVTDFPEGVVATSVENEFEGQVSREELLAAIVREIIALGSLCDSHFKMIVDEANAHSALQGKDVQLQQGEDWHRGVMAGINQDGHLLLHHASGELSTIAQANTVRIL